LNTKRVVEVIKGVIKGKELPFPDKGLNPCRGKITPGCPIRKDTEYTIKAPFEIKKFYPPVCSGQNFLL